MDPRTDLVRHYRWLRRFGLNDSHSGNASVRDGGRLWITPTGACADTLEPADLVGGTLEAGFGDGASLDAPLHLAVYRANPQAAAVLHSHGPHTVAVTFDGEDFLPPDFEGQYYFGTIPVLRIAYERYLAESPPQVAAALVEHPVTVVRGHGVYAWGPSVNLAYKWTSSLELSARTALLAMQAGTLKRPD